MLHFVGLPPLECHELFEWPLTNKYLSDGWASIHRALVRYKINFMNQYKDFHDENGNKWDRLVI